MASYGYGRPRVGRPTSMPFPATPVHENLFHRRAAVSLDIIVVGGSISGLSAAYNLRQAGHNVRVLERSNRELKVSIYPCRLAFRNV